MKVYEMSFRDMDQKMVEIHGMKMGIYKTG